MINIFLKKKESKKELTTKEMREEGFDLAGANHLLSGIRGNPRDPWWNATGGKNWKQQHRDKKKIDETV